ncbi:MAG: hypothetical protein F6K54_21295 [Okeania sp. SIO3B5]|uniref:hypothetical protein n=1 Tax=Okeania sp. SIO3B5 TaxID=2607811 RepID=UPI001400A3C6|nr:hypothetical protein [Okeania sp. SIO3B5]NEO55377.1 hypothetical protein [Okeania sp. SIO3B5]
MVELELGGLAFCIGDESSVNKNIFLNPKSSLRNCALPQYLPWQTEGDVKSYID